jgi:hypothetical protein
LLESSDVAEWSRHQHAPSRLLAIIRAVSVGVPVNSRVPVSRPRVKTRVTIAGTEDEFLDSATAHAVAKHGHKDTSELREMIRSGLEDVRSPA